MAFLTRGLGRAVGYPCHPGHPLTEDMAESPLEETTFLWDFILRNTSHKWPLTRRPVF